MGSRLLLICCMVISTQHARAGSAEESTRLAGQLVRQESVAKVLAELEPVIVKVVRDKSISGKPITALHIGGQDLTDDMLRRLTAFSDLKSLHIYNASISAKGLRHLANFGRLEELGIEWMHVPKGGLSFLQKLPKLRSLNLFATETTDSDLGQLKPLKNLKQLTLDRETCTDQGVSKLQRALPDLKIDRGNNNTAEKRLRKHFAVPQDKPLSEKEVKFAILKNLPVGSSPEGAYAFLKKRGVGSDGFSSFYPYDENREIVCRIGYDPESGYYVHRHYCLIFKMDQENKLKGVVLKTWYTGP